MARIRSVVFLSVALAWGSSLVAAGPVSMPAPYAPDPASVRRSGAGYRYPSHGWIVIHVEGTPYDRGYQHGRLLAPEIAEFIKTLATYKGSKAPAEAWKANRRLVDALFLRRYEAEYLEEMKGIADGAAAAGANFEGQPVDLIDIVAINSDIEVSFLDPALDATAHGLENLRFPDPNRPRNPSEDHCSAFAATGPATKDGKIVFGHITMWNIFHAQHFNIWLDVKPEAGHRVLMQTYPGGIQSGLDYYMNDHGILAAETTIEQTPFEPNGKPLAGRMRHALQYGTSIDDVVSILRDGNNGLYTNEWLLADINTNEIAMFELGTRKERLWRSSKNEWFGGTEGFYWGCNNAKDLDIRLETLPTTQSRPANVVFHPSDRDHAWLELFDQHKGQIDAAFGLKAFTTPPLAGFPSLDAKVTTTDMARRLESFALFGPPMGKTWEPSPEELSRDPSVRPIVANDWSLLRADPPLGTPPTRLAVDLAGSLASYPDPIRPSSNLPLSWHGTILPATDADIWLAAAFADYERIAAFEKSLGAHDPGTRLGAYTARPEVEMARPQSKNLSAARRDHLLGSLPRPAQDALDLALFAPRSRYSTAVRHNQDRDIPLAEIKADLRNQAWYPIAAGKGVLLLHALRNAMGTARFDASMDKFGREHAGKPVTSEAFFRELEAAHGASLASIYERALKGPKEHATISKADWSIESFELEPEKALIVYGTTGEADPQREAAFLLQRKIERRWRNSEIPVKADKDLSENESTGRHLVFVGRPSTNAATAKFAASFPVSFGPGSFQLRNETFGHEASAIVFAVENPGDPRYSIVVFAGLGADATRRIVQTHPGRGNPPTPALLLPAGGFARPVLISPTPPAWSTLWD